MEIFLTNLSKIKRKKAFLKDKTSLLLIRDKRRLDRIIPEEKKLQFLIGRLMIYRFLGTDFKIEKSGKLTAKNKYLSLTHSKNLVILALANSPIGIDTEYTNKKRNYQKIADFLHLGKCKNRQDFYKLFTQYEADYKIGKRSKKIEHIFLMWKKYLICIASVKNEALEIFEYIPRAK